MIESLIQGALSSQLASEYLTWLVYKPSRNIASDWSNVTEALGSSIASFIGSLPSQKPKEVIDQNAAGDALIQSSVYNIDILKLTAPIEKSYFLKLSNSTAIYQPTITAGADLVGTNVKLEVKLIRS